MVNLSCNIMTFKSNFVCIVFLVFSMWFFYSYFDSMSYAQLDTPEFTTNDSVIDTIKFDSTGTISVNKETNTVYITNSKAGTVSIIDGTTNKIIDVFDAEKSAFGIGVNQQTNMIYVAIEHKNILYVVNGSSNQIEDKIEMNDPYDIAVDYNANMIYVTSDRFDLVYAVDGDTNKIASTFEVQDPCGVAVNPETGRVYVTSESTNMVHVIDGKKK